MTDESMSKILFSQQISNNKSENSQLHGVSDLASQQPQNHICFYVSKENERNSLQSDAMSFNSCFVHRSESDTISDSAKMFSTRNTSPRRQRYVFEKSKQLGINHSHLISESACLNNFTSDIKCTSKHNPHNQVYNFPLETLINSSTTQFETDKNFIDHNRLGQHRQDNLQSSTNNLTFSHNTLLASNNTQYALLDHNKHSFQNNASQSFQSILEPNTTNTTTYDHSNPESLSFNKAPLSESTNNSLINDVSDFLFYSQHKYNNSCLSHKTDTIDSTGSKFFNENQTTSEQYHDQSCGKKNYNYLISLPSFSQDTQPQETSCNGLTIQSDRLTDTNGINTSNTFANLPQSYQSNEICMDHAVHCRGVNESPAQFRPDNACTDSCSNIDLRLIATEFLQMARNSQPQFSDTQLRPTLADANTIAQLIHYYRQQQLRSMENFFPDTAGSQEGLFHHDNPPQIHMFQTHSNTLVDEQLQDTEETTNFDNPTTHRAYLSKILKSLVIDDKIIQRIDHSAKFSDDIYEYRFVMLPRNHPLLNFESDDQIRNLLMTEAEWRAVGIRQTRGWEHCDYSRHESHVFLFRRPIGTDPRTGKISKSIQENMKRRSNETTENQSDLNQLQTQPLIDTTKLWSIPTYGSTQSTASTDPMNFQISATQQSALGINPVSNVNSIADQNFKMVNWVIARNLYAVMKNNVLRAQPPTVFFDLEQKDYEEIEFGKESDVLKQQQQHFSNENVNEFEISERYEFLNEIDQLYAAMHTPLYAT